MATKIMVIDDDPLIGQLLSYQLGGLGYQVVYVNDPLRALGRLVQEQPDLVMLDVMMPGMCGWDLATQIRSSLAVPIIMLSAKGAETDIVQGLQSGADDYVLKPFTIAQLSARIEAVLRRSRRKLEAAQRPAVAAVPIARPAQPVLVGAQSASHRQEQTALPLPRAGLQPVLLPPARLGERLRRARVAQGLTLHQAERASGVRWEFLQALETEQFSYIPRQQLSEAMRGYCRILGLDMYELIGRAPPTAQPASNLPYTIGLIAVCLLIVMLMSISLL